MNVKDNSQKFIQAMKDNVEKGLEACGHACITYAVQNLDKKVYTGSSGVKSSRLRQGTKEIKVINKNELHVGTDVEYAWYVEHGTGIYAGGRPTPWSYKDPRTGEWRTTRGMRAREFLRPAMKDHVSTYKDILKRYLKD